MVQNTDFFKHISGLILSGGYRLDFTGRCAYVPKLDGLAKKRKNYRTVARNQMVAKLQPL